MKSQLIHVHVRLACQLLLASGIFAWALAANGQDALDEGVREQVEFHILAAELAGQRGALGFAAGEYLKALELAPNVALAERATRVALYAEVDEVALRAAQIWVALVPERFEARQLLVRLALRAGDADLAYAQAVALLRSYPHGQGQAFRDMARSLGGEIESGVAALALLQKLVKDFPDEEAGYYALGLLALRQDDPAEAEVAANRALALAPDWADAVLLKATALLRQSRQPEADALIAEVDLDDEKMAGLHMAYARLLLEAELSSSAITQFEAALDYESDNPEALYALSLLYLNAEDYDAAYPYLNDLYDLDSPRQSEAAYYLGGIEEQRGDFEEALEWYRRVNDGSHDMPALQQQAYVLYRLDRMDEARRLLAQQRQLHDENAMRLYMVEGELLFQARDFKAAAMLYDQALAEYPNEPDLLYGRSLVSERLGRVTLAERDLRKLLEQDPEDPRSLNALGYILTNHSKRYDEALSLITRALAQTPEDATVIDSMGWVQYRLGDLDAAMRFLSEAFQKMPDPEVAAHFGEVLWQLGQRDRAQSIWREALTDDPEHPVLQETIDRLTR